MEGFITKSYPPSESIARSHDDGANRYFCVFWRWLLRHTARIWSSRWIKLNGNSEKLFENYDCDSTLESICIRKKQIVKLTNERKNFAKLGSFESNYVKHSIDIHIHLQNVNIVEYDNVTRKVLISLQQLQGNCTVGGQRRTIGWTNCYMITIGMVRLWWF